MSLTQQLTCQSEPTLRNKHCFHNLQLLIAIMLGLLLAGCSSSNKIDPVQDTTATLSFSVDDRVNPDINNRPSPIVVNILFLKSNRQFEQEDLISLMQNAEDRLGTDLAKRVRLKEFIPGEQRTEEFVLNDGITHLGVFAEFINYRDAEAKLLLPLELNSVNAYEITVDRLSLRNIIKGKN